MKNFTLFLIAGIILLGSCKKKDTESEKFKLLTAHTWTSDSLLVNGLDESGPAGRLEAFKGDAKFNTDHTGTFSTYSGTWRFETGETELVITTDAYDNIPITTAIKELTASSLKITTVFPNLLNPAVPLNVRMTFKPK